jgi:predicted nucleic-acid-binding Zn-ribbon protein
MAKTLVCPKCAGAMLEGFVPASLNETEVSPIAWTEGQPEEQSPSVNESTMRFPIKTFCCRKCGFLEFYAG